MDIRYIFHSSFLVETRTCYCLFDYYKGKLPSLKKEKPVLVFASHGHPDHYDAKIFSLLKNMGMEEITAVLSKDIPLRNHPQDIPVIQVTHHQEYTLPYEIRLETFLSTDEGVAFLLTCAEGCIYHAGDLNDWVWEEESEQYNKQMTGSYRHEIDMMKGRKVDIAFLPLDPRQGKDYSRGVLYFIKQVKVDRIFPMHYWEKPKIIRQFITEYSEHKNLIAYTEDYQ